ncbi:signal peptidase I [Candidatus Clostridium helianthi]|jgi:signal peptidase I|uniref:Signal peptidase I n=1 Tax=Candidatus Clostridium helianthi TaxID=3381660 RepID=A0ABW8RZX0_9CLOT
MNASKTKNEIIIQLIKEYAIVIIGAIALTFIISIFVKPGQVAGESMTNTLQDKDLLLINRVAYKLHAPEYKDIVVLNTNIDNDRILIKRVIGVPGDTIEVKDNVVYVNGNKLDEKYIREPMVNNQDLKLVVSEGKIFVMGDNRNNSLDSRSLMVGMIDYKKDVIGKVMLRIFPFKELSKY